MSFMEQASTAAEKVDAVFLFILALCVAFLIFITFLMIFFVIKYSRRRHPKARDIEGNTWLEIAWTAIPLVLFLTMFYFGWTNFAYVRNAPRDAMVVKVTARQWAWQFQYPNGRQTDELYCALDKPVRLEIRSADVIHGFYVPAFRIKMDAVPGRENYTWFIPTQIGSFDIECSVICGTNHTYMLSKAVVVPEDDFKNWYFGGEDAPAPGKIQASSAVPEKAGHPGFRLLREMQCLTCHSTDGRVMVGPTFKGVYGGKEIVKGSADGMEREIVVDEAHLRRAIQDPMAEILKGYPPVMPLNPLAEKELGEVIDYIRNLQ